MSQVSITNDKGCPIKDLGQHFITAAQKKMQEAMLISVKERTAHLHCTTHQQGISDIKLKQTSKGYTASLDCCCPDLQNRAVHALQDSEWLKAAPTVL
ncbi:MAG: hypothetical protein JSS83_17635 [Cyanobacteria bacterium SZAS LIN-3]|nr:hypothetical protein [Cyanobacteria bacterium SZAS LIN-3]